MIRCFLGYDEREAVAMHVCTSSILRRASKPVSFCYLADNQIIDDYCETHVEGSGLIKPGYQPSNAFVHSRFLVPWLCGYEGWAIFMDGDMIVKADIADLWRRRDPHKALLCVQHDYRTKHSTKYFGQPNQDYPRKMWSSVVLWNCAHPKNRKLGPEYVMQAPGSHLHRFAWLDDADIGALPIEWNWLVSEYEQSSEAKLLHYTIGGPYLPEYADCDHAADWGLEFSALLKPFSEPTP
ncbi:MAG: hypothetical protein NHG36_07905 [Chromatiaceae bacterium]|nr:hypothetical protein [Candidatus Thioaporhodococcus sediminis]